MIRIGVSALPVRTDRIASPHEKSVPITSIPVSVCFVEEEIRKTNAKQTGDIAGEWMESHGKQHRSGFSSSSIASMGIMNRQRTPTQKANRL